ncbi:acyloxyacyl hydrolase [Actimicrobium antarcticum]|uniref:Acyloxyacyl hydrolase n=1 Tax=Actimicrobium antarcticum TaxID=1051899 RepID=A0ABP7SNI0_9BURK
MSNTKSFKALVIGCLLCVASSASMAVDSMSAEVGTGNKSQIYRLGMQWNMDQQWMRSDKSEIWGYWDLTAAVWRANQFENRVGATQTFLDIGFTPTLRWQGLNHQGVYAEAGLGPHINSDVYDNFGRRLSTNLQFGTHLGLGYTLASGLDLSLRVTHFSNGGIKQPNNGVNFAVARIGYKF